MVLLFLSSKGALKGFVDKVFVAVVVVALLSNAIVILLYCCNNRLFLADNPTLILLRVQQQGENKGG